MITMRCERCGEDKPLEHFEVSLQRTPLIDPTLEVLDTMRREPEQICRDCFQPSGPFLAADRVLSPKDGFLLVDLLADTWDWLRRHAGRSDS